MTAISADRFDDAAERVLPPAVRDRIARQQDQSEKLIGWIQLAIVITFALLYISSPRAGRITDDWQFATGVAIGVYFALTVIRLFLSYRIRLGSWLLAGSIVIDMILLYGLIWTFHKQYGQPPSFYLKAPTLLYVFIFVALRALRFETRYVVLAGVVAASGWLAMFVYVVLEDPGHMVVTRDYVKYLTSNSILVGAEIDKIVSILMVTGIIALAIHRARSLLFQAVTESQAKENLSRFFSPEIAKRISWQGDTIIAGTGEARDAAILNLDVRGFTRLASTISPQEVMSLLADYQGQMVRIIQRHGGSIDKFLGDGIMATFGATQPQEDYAARALAALEECMAVAKDWTAAQGRLGRPLEINGAVASGRVVVGAVGDESRLEFTVIGDAANLSAKLEKHNKSQGSRAIVLAETYDAALAQGYGGASKHQRVAGASVAGVETPLDLVVLA